MLAMALATQNGITTDSGQSTMIGPSRQSRSWTSSDSCPESPVNGFFKAVAESAHRHDAHAARLELLAQPVHVDFDRVRGDFLAPLAQVRDELVLRHQAPA